MMRIGCQSDYNHTTQNKGATGFAWVAQAGMIAMISALAACGNGTVGNGDAGYHGDVIHFPNASWCSLIRPDVAVIVDPANPATSAVLCGPDMPVGTRCPTMGNPFQGVCRDFVAESGGLFADYARMNRVPRYCLPEGVDPCRDRGTYCAFGVACIRIPSPPPGSAGWMCPPEPCN